MRQYCLRIPLLLASSLLVQTAWAQQATVEPLAPVQAVAESINVAKALGRPVPSKTPEAAKSSAAPTAASQTQRATSMPLVLVDMKIITSLATIAPNDIQAIEVFKDPKFPSSWRAITTNGVINLRLKPKVKVPSISLAKLKQRYHLSGPVKFELNGLPLEDTSLRVATHDISKLEISPVADGQGYKTLNIKLVEPSAKSNQDPPGTIRIRGMASR